MIEKINNFIALNSKKFEYVSIKCEKRLTKCDKIDMLYLSD